MSRHATPSTVTGRQRVNFVVIAAGVVAAVVLALTFSGTLSAFTQAFLHPTNTVSSKSISIQETDSSGTASTSCTTTSPGVTSCTNPDLYGNQVLKPGETSSTQTISFKNTGTAAPTSFSVKGGTCTTNPSSGAALCNQLVVYMTWRGADFLSDGTTPNALAANSQTIPNPPAAGERFELTVKVKLPSNATDDTSGVTLTQPLTFTFSS